MADHIPYLENIVDFYRLLRIGFPLVEDFSIMRIEDQPDTKRKLMPLFRSNFYRIVILNNSAVEWRLPGQSFETTDHCVYFSYPGKLESWEALEKNEGFLICFTEAFAHFDTASSPFSTRYPYFNFEASSLLPLQPNEADLLGDLATKMLEETTELRGDRSEMILHLLHQCLIILRRLHLKMEAMTPLKNRNGISIFNRFNSELNQYFTHLATNKGGEQASVSAIADLLNINPSYLNTVIKDVSGKPASLHIHEKIILEAKSYLIHTDLNISEISYRLGFTNTTYFNRFFKRMTSNTPMYFRKNH
ncbi:MAG: helix-turn-helix domain-containing protein [Bacteroidota bacterium]